MDSKITTGTTADGTPYVDEEHHQADQELYAAMVRLRLDHVLDQAGKAFAETYRDSNLGVRRWGQMLDEATRQVVRDVVDPMASERDALDRMHRFALDQRDESRAAEKALGEHLALALTERNRLRDGVRTIAGMHDGHDSECPRCEARVLLDAR